MGGSRGRGAEGGGHVLVPALGRAKRHTAVEWKWVRLKEPHQLAWPDFFFNHSLWEISVYNS